VIADVKKLGMEPFDLEFWSDYLESKLAKNDQLKKSLFIAKTIMEICSVLFYLLIIGNRNGFKVVLVKVKLRELHF
jgi:hypothetical protein